jgi:hypothetical protein
MSRNILTSAEIQAKIDAGGTVLYKNRTYKKGDTAPDDATILLDYPLWNSSLLDANAQAINHYQIYGTPNDGDSIVWDATDLRYEYSVLSGSNFSQVGSSTILTDGSTGGSYLQFREMGSDPTSVANNVHLYAKDKSGVSCLYFKKDDTMVGEVAGLSNKLSDFTTTTSAELKTVISDETGSENLVFRLAPTLKNIVVLQNQNNDDIFLARRATDSSPTGTFINYKNAANNTELFKVDITGSVNATALTLGNSGITLGKTNTAAATTGAQTINKSAGTVNFAASATSLVVTNSLVTTTSLIICTVQINDATLKSVVAVPASGSFTLFANVAATAETSVAFLVIN